MKAAKEKDFQQVTNEYAVRCIESMRDDLEALEHARECDGTDKNGNPCTRGTETRVVKLSDGRTVKQAVHDNPEAWHSEDSAKERIDEGPLEIKTDKGERYDGTRHYMILLGTGGPASRIIGELNQYGEAESATFQYQDWYKPWTDAELSDTDEKTLLEYASQFYFGACDEDN